MPILFGSGAVASEARSSLPAFAHVASPIPRCAGSMPAQSSIIQARRRIGFKALDVMDDVSTMDREKVGSESAALDDVSGTLWQKTVLTSCVLAGCLAVIAVLTIF